LRVKKSISSFFLLLAGMAIIAHMAIPHDHHLSVTMSGLKESCTLSHEKSGHHPVLPAHCHAFNDLAAEKFSPVIVKQESQTSFVSVIWRPDNIIPGLLLVKTIVENTGKPFPNISIPEFSPFRAPPSSC
jgi:hypothetical protein